MNRIILIGNGFDLAHDLKTGYRDFINNYWEDIFKCLHDTPDGCYNYNDVKIQLTDKRTFFHDIDTLEKFIKSIIDHNTPGSRDKTLYLSCSVKNRFLIHITNRHLEKWVDVEYEYFKCMQKALAGKYFGIKSNITEQIKVLNGELARIEILFTDYLDKKRGEPKYNDAIKRNIFSAINIRDLSTSYVKFYCSDVIDRIEAIIKKEEEEENSKKWEYDADYQNEKERTIKQYSNAYPFIDSSVDYYEKYIRSIGRNKNVKSYIKEWLLKDNANIPELFIVPKEVMFVNFNYTDTHEHYLPSGSDFIRTQYIHGQLKKRKKQDKPYNPIIFGYGDELCTEYKEFENSAESEFLKNVKSIRYLETDNYRKVLELADADKFQIFLMGHSCGLSDRTLLNTLFEHENCVSIKPFYYIKDDGTDDYNDIVRNISRNFTDKPLMRNRVVNKTYCTTLSSE